MQKDRLSKHARLCLGAYVKLMRATSATTAAIHQHLRTVGLTYSQFAVLEALYHLGPMCQGALGEKILRSHANLTTVVDGLERKKLVRRERSGEDRRQVRVHLSDAGMELIAEVFPRHTAGVEERFSVLSVAELQELARLLKKLGLQHSDTTGFCGGTTINREEP